MSVEIFSGTLAVKENVGGNFQRHFSCDKKMSMEISSDILAVRENVSGNFQRQFSCDRKKCWWKFPATFWLWEKMSVGISSDILAVTEKNVDGNFQRHFGCERKMSVEISSVGHFNCADKCWWSFQWRKAAVEISSDILALRENCTFKTNVQ